VRDAGTAAFGARLPRETRTGVISSGAASETDARRAIYAGGG